MFYELAALGAALSWVFASLIAADVSKKLGGIAYNRIRIVASFFMLLFITLALGSLQQLNFNHYPILIVSGIIGLAVGDSALFATFKRLGPRRSQVLYACNAPITVILGILFLNEAPGWFQLGGIVMVFTGVVIAILWGTHASQTHRWEEIQGSLLLGVGIGLIAALSQAIGSLLIKPVLNAGADPIAVSAVRLGAAALILVSLRLLKFSPPAQARANLKDVGLAVANSFLAIVVGVSLLMYAFSQGDIGTASILSATTPVLMLPFLWLSTRERPALGAWLGASLAVIGTAVIMTV